MQKIFIALFIFINLTAINLLSQDLKMPCATGIIVDTVFRHKDRLTDAQWYCMLEQAKLARDVIKYYDLRRCNATNKQIITDQMARLFRSCDIPDALWYT